MDLGTRTIRSAGRGSGSIEITLPSSLRALNGLRCTVSWHARPPHIVLTPDTMAAEALLGEFWRRLTSVLRLTAMALPPLSPDLAAAASAGLQWDDVLALCADAPHEALAVSRILAALAAEAEDAIAPPVASGFAAALAFVATGVVPARAWQEDCVIVAAAFAVRPAAPVDALADGFWAGLDRQAGPVTRLFRGLAADPARHAALRAAVRTRAVLDLSGLL